MLRYLSILYAIFKTVSMQCLSRYITAPIQGHCCSTLVFANISALSYQRCIGLCITNDACWAASYNHPEQYCFLASETCVSSDRNIKFSMANIRPSERQHCIKWVPFNNTLGIEEGFPPRIINYNEIEDTIARVVHGQDVLTGWATHHVYNAYVIGWDYTSIEVPDYEVLLVENSCSTAWVPYIIGDPMPRGVVVAGVDRDSRNKYIVRIISNERVFYGSYTNDDAFAYFEYQGVWQSTVVNLLVELY